MTKRPQIRMTAKERARLAALARYEILDTEPEEAFDRLTRLASKLTGNPIALVSLIDHSRQWFKSKVGLEASETDRALAFCDHAIRGHDILHVPDATKDKRFSDNPLVTGEPGIRFYAGAPLQTSDGYNLGTLCVIDTEPKQLSANDKSILTDLADLVVDELELRRTSRQLNDSNARLHDAISSMSEGYIQFDTDDRLVLANPAFHAMFPALADILAPGLRYQDMVKQVIERGCITFGDTTPSNLAEQRRANRSSATAPFILQLSDQRWIQIADNRTSNGGTVSVLTDISETKAREQQLKRLEDILSSDDQTPAYQIPQLLEFGCDVLGFDMGIQSRITDNVYKPEHAYLKSDGIADLPDFETSQTFCHVVVNTRNILHLPDAAASEYANHPCHADMGIRSYIGAPLMLGNEVHGTMNFSSQNPRPPLRSQDIARFQIIVQWINIIMQREKDLHALIRQRELAKDANRAKSQFLAMMSHEIRTPLNGLLGTMSLLRRTSMTDEQQEMLGVAQLAGQTLMEVINDILDFSKLEADRMELEIIPFEIRPLLRNAIDILSPQARSKNLDIIKQVDDSIDGYWLGDPSRIRQILINLVGNAIKFTEQGSVIVSATMHKPAEVIFAITDTGAGIPKDRQKLLFKEFSQIDASINRQHGGSGLGLAISRKLVELMNGEIWVESQTGKGSTFKFTIPVEATAPPAETEQSFFAGQAQESSEHVFTPLAVLVAEDNSANQFLMRKAITSFGHQIDIASDGQEAINLACAKPYDIILMDIQMPNVDGIQAMQQIHKLLDEPPPVIAMTAQAFREDRYKLLEAGFDGYRPKPVDLEALESYLRRLSIEKYGADQQFVASVSEDSPTAIEEPILDTQNLDYLAAAVGKNDIKELIQTFSTNTTERVLKITEALSSKNLKAVVDEAHSLAGAAANMGAIRIHSIAREIEHGEDISQMSESFSKLKQQLALAHNAFTDYLEKI